MTVTFLSLIVGGYLLGSVPAAYLVVKWSRGIDIRQYGSGNVGASNVAVVASKWLAVLVTVFDVGKGMLVVWLSQRLGLGAAGQVTTGLAAIIGHNWPVFLRFRGGRGIYTSLGVIIVLSPQLGLISLLIAYILAPIRQVALGVFLGLAALPVFSWFLSGPLDIEARLPLTIGFAVLTLIALSRRLMAPMNPLGRSVPPLELLLNRLLFDRDIRDRKAWIHQAPADSAAASPGRQPEKQSKG